MRTNSAKEAVFSTVELGEKKVGALRKQLNFFPPQVKYNIRTNFKTGVSHQYLNYLLAVKITHRGI